jgi:hypothetical protein
MKPSQNVKIAPEARLISAKQYAVGLGIPKWLGLGKELPAVSPYWPGQPLEFGSTGNAAPYLGLGWSEGETWGRWSDGRLASLRFALNEFPEEDLELSMNMGAFVHSKHPTQVVEVLANDTRVALWKFSLIADGQEPSLHTAVIPRELVRRDAMLRVAFKLKDAAAPADFGLSGDNRRLGIAVKSAVIQPRSASGHYTQAE